MSAAQLPPSPLRGWTQPVSAEMLQAAAQMRAPESAVRAMGRLKQDFQAEYSAGMPSRFRRTRTSLGGMGDSHMLVSIQFWNTREYARDMDRNDAVFKQLVDRAVDVRIGTGPNPRPMTGDRQLDAWLSARWRQWSSNPHACDASKLRAFPEIVRTVERATIVDGDIFAVPIDEGEGAGSIQLVEGDRVDSPQAIGGDLFRGIRVSKTGAPTEYHFIEVSDHLSYAHLIYYAWANSPSHLRVMPAFDEDGLPVVLHFYDPSRVSQRRGITAFHAVFDYFGMLEDTMFSTLVKQQMAACVMGYLESPWDMAWGSRSNETQNDGTLQVLQELQPGVVLRGQPGTKLSAFTPNIPGSDFLNHLQFNLRLLGGALHLPLEVALMDYSAGNFSSQRMALDQARQGVLFRRESMSRLLLQHVYSWKARGWLEDRGVDWREHPEVLDHKWRWPGWPYHDKRDDAEADKIRVDNLQVSPRDLAQENGYEWEEIVEEAVEDNALALEAAIARAAKIQMPEGANPLDPRELLNRALPGGVTTNTSTSIPIEEQKAERGRNSMDRAEIMEILRAERAALVGDLARQIAAHMAALVRQPPAPAAPAPTMSVHADSVTIQQADGAPANIHAQLGMAHPVTLHADKVEIAMEEGAVKVESNINVEAPAVTFSPTIEAKAGETIVRNRIALEVEAKLPPRDPVRQRITHADGSVSTVEPEVTKASTGGNGGRSV